MLKIKYQISKPKSARGFTFIELMLVVIIIGVLAAMVLPKFTGRSEQARITAAKADIASIGLALDMFEMDIGHYPASLDQLKQKGSNPDSWKGPYLKKSAIDPWGRPYEYTPSPDSRDYKLCSKGPLQAGGSEKQICNTDEASQSQ